VVCTAIRWNDPTTSAFGVSSATCWRQSKEWHEAGVWQRAHETLLLSCAPLACWDLAHTVVDSSHLRALKEGTSPVPARSTGPAGSKHHLITDDAGMPLAMILTGGHRNDVTQLPPLVDAIPPIHGLRGRPR
jgi:transposase